jgi:hypothetical protein
MPKPRGTRCQGTNGERYDSLYEMKFAESNPQVQRNQVMQFSAKRTERYKPDFTWIAPNGVHWVIETKVVSDSAWRAKLLRVLEQNPGLMERFLLVLLRDVKIHGKGSLLHSQWAKKNGVNVILADDFKQWTGGENGKP